MTLKSKTYDILKEIVTKWLPFVAAILELADQIWVVPFDVGKVVLFVTGIAGALGTLIGISSRNYWNNNPYIYEDEDIYEEEE